MNTISIATTGYAGAMLGQNISHAPWWVHLIALALIMIFFLLILYMTIDLLIMKYTKYQWDVFYKKYGCQGLFTSAEVNHLIEEQLSLLQVKEKNETTI